MDVFLLLNGLGIAFELCTKVRHLFAPRENLQAKLNKIAWQLEKIQNVLPPEDYQKVVSAKALPENTATAIGETLAPDSIQELKNIYDETCDDVTNLLNYVKETAPESEALAEITGLMENNPVFSRHLTSYASLITQGKAFFRIDGLQGPAKGAMWIVQPSEELRIGRSKGTITLEDSRLSPEHCRIWNDQGILNIEDLSSGRGVFVNLAKICKPVTVKDGNSLLIGSSFCKVVEVKKREAVQAASVGECECCQRPATGHAVEQHRVIERKGRFFCMRCICNKGAGDFPTVGKYRILHKIGKGGMADVYLAVQTAMFRMVAFKWLRNMLDPSPDKMRRFNRECEVSAQLLHPNVVQFFDAGSAGSTYYIVMEYVQGDTLEDRLKAKGKFPVEDVVSIAFQLLEALDFAYKKHIVHRDLKPGNVFITGTGVVKLSDFGLAKYFDEVGLSQNETRSGMSMGTIQYMPPEQFGDAKHVDQRADIYSLGATLYTILTGVHPIPFDGATIPEYVGRVLNLPPKPPSQVVAGIPAELDEVIVKCLAKNPEERFQTPDEIREALAKLK